MKLTLKRLSSLPNQNGSYAYGVISGDTTGIDMVYTNQQGQKFFYSPVLIGSHNVEFETTVQVQEVVSKKQGGIIVKAIRLTGNSAQTDQLAQLANFANQAKRAGIGAGNSALDQMVAKSAMEMFSKEPVAQTP